MKQKISTARQNANAKLKLMETFGDTSFDHHYFAEICDTPITGTFKKKPWCMLVLGARPCHRKNILMSRILRQPKRLSCK